MGQYVGFHPLDVTMDHYIEHAMRTNRPPTAELVERMTMPTTIHLTHAMLGLASEVGELSDAIKRYIYYGTELNLTNVKEELGDLKWYMALLMSIIGTDDDEVERMNIAKLRARYPEKFTEDAAVNRNLSTELEVLQNHERNTE